MKVRMWIVGLLSAILLATTLVATQNARAQIVEFNNALKKAELVFHAYGPGREKLKPPANADELMKPKAGEYSVGVATLLEVGDHLWYVLFAYDVTEKDQPQGWRVMAKRAPQKGAKLSARSGRWISGGEALEKDIKPFLGNTTQMVQMIIVRLPPDAAHEMLLSGTLDRYALEVFKYLDEKAKISRLPNAKKK